MKGLIPSCIGMTHLGCAKLSAEDIFHVAFFNKVFGPSFYCIHVHLNYASCRAEQLVPFRFCMYF